MIITVKNNSPNQGNLLVSETSITALHSGRISIVDPNSGIRRTLLDGIPSAINFYQLKAGNFVQTKKLMLLK